MVDNVKTWWTDQVDYCLARLNYDGCNLLVKWSSVCGNHTGGGGFRIVEMHWLMMIDDGEMMVSANTNEFHGHGEMMSARWTSHWSIGR